MGSWILIVYWASAPTLGPPLVIGYPNKNECLAALRVFSTTVLREKFSGTCHPLMRPETSEGTINSGSTSGH